MYLHVPTLKPVYKYDCKTYMKVKLLHVEISIPEYVIYEYFENSIFVSVCESLRRSTLDVLVIYIFFHHVKLIKSKMKIGILISYTRSLTTAILFT